LPETQGSPEKSRILDRIVETKRAEVESLLRRRRVIEAGLRGAPEPRNLAGALDRGEDVALMAEVKRRSPGAGPIRPDLSPGELAGMYQDAGAAAVSVLTDSEYFGGSLEDLKRVRGAVDIPVFRKDFVLHEIQLLEARAAGADGVLLIARILTDQELASLHRRAVDLGLTALVEVHGPREAHRALEAGVPWVGVNNRNLQTFETSLDVTLEVLPLLAGRASVVSESGIRTGADVERLGRAGVHAVLVGESLLRASDPGVAAAELVGRPRVAPGMEGPGPSGLGGPAPSGQEGSGQ